MEEPSDDENDMLDLAFGLTETSRLGCQVTMSKALDGLVAGPTVSAVLQAAGDDRQLQQWTDVHIGYPKESPPPDVPSIINEFNISSSDPAGHGDGRLYATFLDLPHECRDLCYIEYLQTECGDAICKVDSPRPIVARAGRIRILNKQICAEFDGLLDKDVQTALDRATTPHASHTASTRTPAPVQLRINVDMGGPLGRFMSFRHNPSRWLTRSATPQKRGTSWRITYEVLSVDAGYGLKLLGFAKELEIAARRVGLLPTSGLHPPILVALHNVSGSASARELSNIMVAVTAYQRGVIEAERRCQAAPRSHFYGRKQDFNAAMKALRRSHKNSSTWDTYYALARAENMLKYRKQW
nr:hypothetical protein B0A51_03459 [Rachicladosporium sp. CCFEE 5018]